MATVVLASAPSDLWRVEESENQHGDPAWVVLELTERTDAGSLVLRPQPLRLTYCHDYAGSNRLVRYLWIHTPEGQR